MHQSWFWYLGLVYRVKLTPTHYQEYSSVEWGIYFCCFTHQNFAERGRWYFSFFFCYFLVVFLEFSRFFLVFLFFSFFSLYKYLYFFLFLFVFLDFSWFFLHCLDLPWFFLVFLFSSLFFLGLGAIIRTLQRG